jgi:CRP-like cAMP-binding protein
MSPSNGLEEMVDRQLREIDEEISSKEAELRPLLERKKALVQARMVLTRQGMTSTNIDDGQLVEIIRRGSNGKPMTAPRIAELAGLDTRTISRRLPRMVKDGLLEGGKDTGYKAPRR